MTAQLATLVALDFQNNFIAIIIICFNQDPFENKKQGKNLSENEIVNFGVRFKKREHAKEV